MGDFARNKLYYVLNLVLIAPCSILVWRGLWEMGQGLWLVPSRCLRKDPHDCTEHAALMAKVVFCLLGLILRILNEIYQADVGKKVYHPLMKIHPLLGWGFKYIYITINIVISILQWSGSWALLDSAHLQIKLNLHLTDGSRILLPVIFTLLFGAILAIFGCLPSLIAPPLEASTDFSKNVFGTSSLHRPNYQLPITDSNFSLVQCSCRDPDFCMDQFLSSVISVAKMCCWWGIWALTDELDQNIIPWTQYFALNSLPYVYIGMGYGSCSICFLAQFVIMHMFKQKKPSRIVESLSMAVLAVLSGIGSLVAWKGIWNSADLLMAKAFPPNTFAWVLVPFGVSVPILIILGAYSTATFRGVASNPRDNCKMFLVEYENPYAMLLKCVRKTEELQQRYLPTRK